MSLHCSFEHLKHKLWPKEGSGIKTANLTPDHKKSGIHPIYLATKGVSHTIGKLSTRATTLLKIASRFEVCSQSYEAPKSWESQLARFWDSHSGGLGREKPFGCRSVASHKVYYKGEASPKSRSW
jgi:hypothetical protein